MKTLYTCLVIVFWISFCKTAPCAIIICKELTDLEAADGTCLKTVVQPSASNFQQQEVVISYR